MGWLYKLVPKIGPLRPLQFTVPTPEAEALFLASFTDTREHYRASLAAIRNNDLTFANTDFDTGRLAAYGEYRLADETYEELLDRLAKRQFAGVPPALRANFHAFYAAGPIVHGGRKERRRAERIRRQLTALDAAS
jgi:hypothetical protein